MYVCVCAFTEGDLPPKLPTGAFVNPRVKKDIRALASYLSQDERDWMEEMLAGRNLTRIIFDGGWLEGGLPGRPAHMDVVNSKGEYIQVNLRVVDYIPKNWLELSPDRARKMEQLIYLSDEELRSLPRTYFVNESNPPAHPAWHGARELTREERQAQDIAFASASAPWKKIAHLLKVCADKKSFEGKHMVVAELKMYLRQHGVPTQDRHRKPLPKKGLVEAAWDHSRVILYTCV